MYNFKVKDINNKKFHITYRDIKFKINEINPLLEIKREMIFDKIKYLFSSVLFKCIDHFLLTKTYRRTEHILNNMFSKYIMNALSKNNTIDPLIPYDYNDIESFMIDISTEIEKFEKIGEKQKGELEVIIKYIKENMDFKKWFNDGFDKLYSYYLSDEYILSKNNMNKQITINDKNMTIYYYGEPVTLHINLYNKIMNRFDINFSQDKDLYIWCLCKRYSILSSMNNQLAVHYKTMKIMQNKYNICFELFGSVFNTFNKNYCSLFYDIEKYFGSVGSFFDLEIKRGNFSMNPPFDPVIIKDCVQKCEDILKYKSDILILIWIPIWDIEGITYLRKNCGDPEKEAIYKKHKKKIFNFKYEGLEIIKNSKYEKFTRIICGEHMTYLDYISNKKKYVAPTYLIGFSNKHINKHMITNLKTKW
jgi:hypothetical protein